MCKVHINYSQENNRGHSPWEAVYGDQEPILLR